MINSKDILTRLQNGDKAEDIANELISALNDATKAYDEEQAAKAEDSKRKANMVKDMQVILDLMHDFCIEYYCDKDEDIDTVNAAFADLTAEKAIELIEEAGATVIALNDFTKAFGAPMIFGGGVAKSKDKPKTIKNVDDTINNFLKSIGL